MPDNNDPEDVGYGRPPAKSRFKPGQSGNLKGRPKAAKNFKTVLTSELNDRVAVNENGKRKRITKRQVIIKQLVNQAAGGNLKAISSLFNETRDHEKEAAAGPSFAMARPEDQAVMEGILRRIRAGDAGQAASQGPGDNTPAISPDSNEAGKAAPNGQIKRKAKP